MSAWTDSEFNQGRADPRPVRVNWWGLLGFLLMCASALLVGWFIGWLVFVAIPRAFQ